MVVFAPRDEARASLGTSPPVGGQLPPGITLTPLLEQGLTELPQHYVQLLTVELAPGVTEPRHVHGGDEFLLLREGHGAVEIDGLWTALEPGKVLHVAPGQTKALRNSSTSSPLRVQTFLVLDRTRSSFQPVEAPLPVGTERGSEVLIPTRR
jgi:quercetin dioxygenase-like cupin family protein